MSNRHIMAKDRPHRENSRYLGDGLYAYHDGYGFWVTAENGVAATDAVYLEPQVWAALFSFIDHAVKEKKT